MNCFKAESSSVYLCCLKIVATCMTPWETPVLFEDIKKGLVLPSGLSNFFKSRGCWLGSTWLSGGSAEAYGDDWLDGEMQELEDSWCTTGFRHH